jgi:signal transduction histidine kinase
MASESSSASNKDLRAKTSIGTMLGRLTTERRNAELAILNTVQAGLAEGLASKRDIQAIYDLVGDKIRELFPNMQTEIRIYSAQTNLIHFPYFVDAGNRIAVDPLPLSNTSMSAHALRTGQTLVINENIAQEIEKYGLEMISSGHHAKSVIFVPLMVGSRARGLIVLGDVEREHAFTQSDVRLLETLAHSMSTALENVRLFEETQRLLKETEQRAAELAIINSVQAGLASKLDTQAIYNLVGDKIRELFNAQSILILTFNPATRTPELKYNFENGQRFYFFKLLSYNKLTEHLIASKKPVVINQNADARMAELGMVIVPGTPIMKSGVFVPLLAGDEVMGFISVQNLEQENAFSEADVSLLSTFASSMSVALENARLYQEQLQVAEELKRVDRMKTQFLSSMSHELRTPLNAIINFVELMARGMIGPVNPDQKELLNQTLNSSKHLLHLINDVLDISKIQAGRLTLFTEEGVNLQDEVEVVLNIVSGLAQEKGLQLIRDIDPYLPLIECDRRRVRQVLLNLLSNAIKFTERGVVTLSVKNRNQEVLFAVLDTGPGIPLAKQELIFEPFVQAGESEREIQGTGLGLPISRSLVHAHGGELWLESDSGEGTAFFFNLPVHERRTS